jgi:hypothetical protein
MEENSVSKIRNDNFNDKQPIPCPDGGCFQAGEQWTYVWTRDTSYAVHLALAALKPKTALNSLKFKTSPKRDGSNAQIVQDTGSGGSYPISSDRVVWALGAEKLLHYLPENERIAFQKEVFDIIQNTIEHDRQVIFDTFDGLYCGEQSFLDWREQTYPGWVADDVIHVGMSKCLSTNLLHLNILQFGAKLAQEAGESDLSNKYRDWANQLRQVIQHRLYLEDSKLYSSFITTFLDNGSAHQYDLLGSVLAILLNVATPERAKDIIANYPVLPNGPSVIWPQQQFTPIYHNRAIWPFVTAYWVKAAQKVGNVAAVNHGIQSLIQGIIRYRSNQENFEVVSGGVWVDEAGSSGPVVDSQAQLWSIAGYLSIVHDLIFGLETSNQGVRFHPYITYEMKDGMFSENQPLRLENFSYQGKLITVTVNLPDSSPQNVEGVYQVTSITLNGQVIPKEHLKSFISSDQLASNSNNTIDIKLSEDATFSSNSGQNSVNLITAEEAKECHNLFAPKYPIITSVGTEADSGKIQVTFCANGERTEDIAFSIYRSIPTEQGTPNFERRTPQEGLLGSDLKWVQGQQGLETSWVDSETNKSSPSYCYTVESYYYNNGLRINNHSQKSKPFCYWGSDQSHRIQTFSATQSPQDKGLKYLGKDSTVYLDNDHEYPYFKNWGKPEDELVLEDFKPEVSGLYLLQVSAANGSGFLNTSITCAVKYMEIFDVSDQETPLIGCGYLIMPQTGSWEKQSLRDSSFVRVSLVAGRTYKIIIRENEYAFNMTYFEHFNQYTPNYGIDQESILRLGFIGKIRGLQLRQHHSLKILSFIRKQQRKHDESQDTTIAHSSMFGFQLSNTSDSTQRR